MNKAMLSLVLVFSILVFLLVYSIVHTRNPMSCCGSDACSRLKMHEGLK